MNLVFAVQLLHISNRFTLILGTVIFFLLAIRKVYRIKPLNSFKNMLQSVVRLLKGTMGLRLLVRRVVWYFSNIIKVSLKITGLMKWTIIIYLRQGYILLVSTV